MGLFLPRLSAAILLACLSVCAFSQAPTPLPVNPRDTLAVLAEQERQRTADPATGTVPYERLNEARQQINQQQAANPNGTAQSGIPGVTWQERGPSNIGGRTRTLLFDPNDATHKKVWAASPAGGLWFTTDITDANASWTVVSDAWENTVVTALATDPSNPQIMYAGTGDLYSNASGGGIWKTTDGGTTWGRLSSTMPDGSYPSINRAFEYIQRIVVNSSGQVFVGTQYGLVRSTDGGSSWSYMLAPNQSIGAVNNTTSTFGSDRITDLELAADGTLYTAFYRSRVFRSTNASGTAWTEITPSGVTGERTELSLALSTSGTGQVIYGASEAYNGTDYGKDIRWFKKSTDGGATWTDVPIPVFSGGNHFTNGNGNSALSLAVSPANPNIVYAGGFNWFASTNGGVSWGNISNGNTYQQGVWFQPGSPTAAALASDNGISWFPDWINILTAPPTLASRNKGYGAGEISSISANGTPGSLYLAAGVRSLGYTQLITAGVSAGSVFWGNSYPGMTLIDQDESDIKIIQSGNTFYHYKPAGSTLLTSMNSYYLPAAPSDYDSQSNTLYATDFINGTALLRRVTGVGTSPQSTTLSLPGVTYLLSCVKLGSDRTNLFAASSGKLYRITNINQPTVTVTNIDNGAFPQYGFISCIDVGATDDELLVIISSFGVQSVWYTSNGGVTWTGKDQTGFGLPDVPVRTALFNPTNRQKVLLGTDAGVWSTDNITAANPGWT